MTTQLSAREKGRAAEDADAVTLPPPRRPPPPQGTGHGHDGNAKEKGTQYYRDQFQPLAELSVFTNNGREAGNLGGRCINLPEVNRLAKDPRTTAYVLTNGPLTGIELQEKSKKFRGKGNEPPVTYEEIYLWWTTVLRLQWAFFPPDITKKKWNTPSENLWRQYKNGSTVPDFGEGRDKLLARIFRAALILLQIGCPNPECDHYLGWDYTKLPRHLGGIDLDHVIPLTKSRNPFDLLSDFDLSKPDNACFLREMYGLRACCSPCHKRRYQWMLLLDNSDLAYPFK